MILNLGTALFLTGSRCEKKVDAFVKLDMLTPCVVEWRARTDWKFVSQVGAGPNVAIDEI